MYAFVAQKKRISVSLTDEEHAFIEWLAERDKMTEQKELQQIFYTELSHLLDLYGDEQKQEQISIDGDT